MKKHFKDDPDKIKESFTVLQMRKGIVFEAQTRVMQAASQILDVKAQDKLERLTRLRSEIARMLLGKTNLPQKEIEKRLAEYKTKADAIEKELVEQSSHLAVQFHATIPGSEALSEALPGESALAEFIHIPEYDFKNRKLSEQKHYLAFILDKPGNVKCIDMGESGAIDDLIRELIQSIRLDLNSLARGKVIYLKNIKSKSKTRTADILSSLYKRIWLPIEKEMNQATCFISPDGILNLLPFAALKSPDRKYLIEKHNLIYLSVGKDILNQARHQPAELELLLVADPDFDLSPVNKPETSENLPAFGIRSRSSVERFNRLPGTRKEASDIPVLFKTGKKKVLTGITATESSVKNPGDVRVLHLATHGFFLESPLCENSSITGNKGRNIGYLSENPLLRSGLAFAGANHASGSQYEDDGILTALEVTGINLHNTDLLCKRLLSLGDAANFFHTVSIY